jgi:hypothetical protein
LSGVASHSESVRSGGFRVVDAVLVSVVDGLDGLDSVSEDLKLVRAVRALVSGRHASVPSNGNLVVILTERARSGSSLGLGADRLALLV